jgi:hypothetical protein
MMSAGGGMGAGSNVGFSFHPARHFNQKMVAEGCSPDIAISYNFPATLALASTDPRSNSSRKCFRNVLSERMPTMEAIST